MKNRVIDINNVRLNMPKVRSARAKSIHVMIALPMLPKEKMKNIN
jgi:hypothetical protein